MKMKMKTLLIGLLLVGAFGIAAAQEKGIAPATTGSGQVTTGQAEKQVDYRTSGTQTLSSMIAYGSFSVGGEDRFGPMFILQYSPRRYSGPAIDFYGGILLQTGTSGPVSGQDYIPLASYYVPYYSPYSNYRNDNYFRMPNFSIGMGFLGADVTFYMLEGEVRPYVGFGGSLALWTYSSRLSGTVAPDAKAGLNINLSNSFSGFAEVRRMFGVPNLLNVSGPKFDGLTSAAIGVSFAPRLR
jgi:hypothetical protein